MNLKYSFAIRVFSVLLLIKTANSVRQECELFKRCIRTFKSVDGCAQTLRISASQCTFMTTDDDSGYLFSISNPLALLQFNGHF